MKKNGASRNGARRLEQLVKDLVADEHKAADAESGLCRFCQARIEAFHEGELEGHLPLCPWYQVRSALGLSA